MGIPASTRSVRLRCPTDKEIISELELARALKYLFIDSCNPDLAKRLANAIRDTATGIHSGKIRSGIFDKLGFTANDVAEYRDSMQEWLRLFPMMSSHSVAWSLTIVEKSPLHSNAPNSQTGGEQRAQACAMACLHQLATKPRDSNDPERTV
jgi:hypothetical protein